MTDLSGTSFGRYQLLEQVGMGGMAVVYKALDTRLDSPVAIKILRTERLSLEQLERILKRFTNEARALARLTHPNLVKVMDYGEQDGRPYLVMEYLPGRTLKEKMGRPIPWRKAVQLLLPIARALNFVHSQNMIHRDVKPSNILLTANGETMLSDFGIAKVLDLEEATDLTGGGMGIGTPEYMAPEQWTGVATPQSDQYSLGVVLYEMLTGRKPYNADTPAAILLKQATEPLPPASSYIHNLPGEIEKLLARVLSRNPAERHANMGSFTAALEGLLSVSPRPEGGLAPLQGTKQQDARYQVVQERPLQRDKRTTVEKPETEKDKTVWIVTAGLVGGSIALCVLAGWLVRNFLNISSFSGGLMQGPTPLIGHVQSSAGEAAVRSSPDGDVIDFIPDGAQVQIQWEKLIILNGETWVRVRAQTASGNNVEGWVLLSLVATPNPAPMPEVNQGNDGMPMAYVPEGYFTMGDEKSGTAHVVYLDAYWMDKFEVTNAMYSRCVGVGACQPALADALTPMPAGYFSGSDYANYPVVNVSWEGAREYCAWVGRKLPTEAEWEKAARGTDGRTYPWGETLDCEHANYSGCVNRPVEAAGNENGKSPYGVYDMAGNVSEWVADWFSETYYGVSPLVNPLGPASGEYRVLRGGSWRSPDSNVRTSYRYRLEPANSFNFIGFRCSRSQ